MPPTPPLVLPAALDRSFAAVLFDMDGTLISSTTAVERSWNRLAQEFAFTMVPFGELHGVPAAATIDAVLADRPPQERAAAVARLLELELTDLAGTITLPGTCAALDAIPEQRRAVVTSATADLAAARLGAAGLGHLRRVTADDVTHGKPHPEPYLAGAALLGVDPADCLVVEDAPPGLLSARAAGMATLALATTHDAAALVADLVVPDLRAVSFVADAAGVRLSVPRNHPVPTP